MTEVVASPPVRIVSVGQQGPAGPPGPDGPSFAGRGGIYIKFPEDETIPVVANSAYAFTINGVRGLKVTSGTLTLSFQVNGINVEGLAGLTVTTTPQSPTSTSANTVAIGNRVTLVIADTAGAAGLEFTTY